jgi:hypothetical protein
MHKRKAWQSFRAISLFALSKLGSSVRRKLLEFNGTVSLGLFISASVALVSSKIILITLHQPLSTWALVFTSPFLFTFDFLTLLSLYLGFSSPFIQKQILAIVVAILILLLSATSSSFYMEANAELNWTQAAVVHLQIVQGESNWLKVWSEWKTLGKLLAEGNGNFLKALVIYITPGLVVMMYRLFFTWTGHHYRISLLPAEKRSRSDFEIPKQQRKSPLVIFLFLLFGICILPAYPWRRLTATLLYDLGKAMTLVIAHHFKFFNTPTNARLGSNPLGDFHYDPAEDPYYISNLDEPVDDFIASAVNGTRFTNVFHIVLESMREDSYPWNENGLLHQHILQNVAPAENGVPITTENVTPFIASLAEHTLSWHTMWATVPYTHKAMLGRNTSVWI